MSFRGRGFLGIQQYPFNAARFMRISAGSFTATQKRALGYLGAAITDLNLNQVLSFIYPFVGGTAALHALNFLSAATTSYNMTFVGSPTHDANGTNFNGTTQYATIFSLGTSNVNLTMSSISMGFNTKSMGAGTYIPMGFFMGAGQQTKTYSTAGTFSFDPTTEAPGFNSFTLSCWGGGGAGGGSNGSVSQNWASGGGAGGNYATRAVTTSTNSGTSFTVVVGSAGTASAGNNGGAGGTSSVVHPDVTGIQAGGGNGGNRNNAASAGALVGPSATVSGTTTFTGGNGAAGGAALNLGGGGGGSSAGTGTNGNAGTTPVTGTGGAGGTAPTGGFAGGQGGTYVNGNGNGGTAPGGGGGGSSGINTVGTLTGGAGSAGRVTISWTPSVFKRYTCAIFNGTGSNLFDASVTTDATSRFSYNTVPSQLDGVRAFTRRGNAGTSADMGFYVASNPGAANAGPAIMATTSLVQSPVLYLGGANSWAASGGVGNSLANPYSGYINFAFIGTGMTDGQLGSITNLIGLFNGILGR